ncbi:MAG: uracil-DNA glycosylase [Patescibacteria group bacterium]
MNSKAELLLQIENNVKRCRKCRLCQEAQNAVPGEGNIDAEIVFIGEAPGATEDQTGRPFVGRAGALLERMLVEIGLKRSDVWIGNIIKHRPPKNRDPLPDEIHACQPYLEMQLKILQPKLIVTLGRFSMNYFYADGKISRDHGRLIKADDYNVFPVYHPAAALRNSEFARALLADIKKIPAVLEEINGIVKEKAKADEPIAKGQIGLGI